MAEADGERLGLAKIIEYIATNTYLTIHRYMSAFYPSSLYNERR